MKKTGGILWLLSCLAIQAHAQQISLGPLHSADSPREDWILPGDTLRQDGKVIVYGGKPMKNPNKKDEKDITQEEKTGYDDCKWGLHKGLNFSVDLSVFATFGKHTPHWGGFTQSINAAYLTPLTKDNKLWMALGGYVNNINYGSDNYHDGGVFGILGYRFNEHWEAYVYGQLSIANNYSSVYGRYAGLAPYGYGRYGYGMYPGMWGGGIMPGGYGMGEPGANVLGAGVRYTNKNFSIGLNVEGVWYNQKSPSYFKQYDYPVPEAPGDKK